MPTQPKKLSEYTPLDPGQVTGDEVVPILRGGTENATMRVIDMPLSNPQRDAVLSRAEVGHMHEITEIAELGQRLNERLSKTGGTIDGDLNVNGNFNILLGAVPLTPTDTGIAGDIKLDNDYIYVCVATDTWKRTPLASW